jgi:hypothetical protein
MLRYLIPALALTLTGCVSQEQITKMNSEAAPPSPALKQTILQAARTHLKDPYSVRDAEISGEITLDAKTNTTAVCVRYNAKNGFGGYVGRTTTAVRLVKGTPVAAFENQAACNHPALRYYPFPETKQLANL